MEAKQGPERRPGGQDGVKIAMGAHLQTSQSLGFLAFPPGRPAGLPPCHYWPFLCLPGTPQNHLEMSSVFGVHLLLARRLVG